MKKAFRFDQIILFGNLTALCQFIQTITHSTMNKKTLQKIIQQPNYNQNLFTYAVNVAQSCQQVFSKLDSIDSKQKSGLMEKQKMLENALKNVIHTFGKFCGIQKAPLATPLDHSIEVFEAISDNIETSVQKYRQANKNAKIEKDKLQKQVKQFQRPQEKYRNIKPAHFQFHSHQKDISNIRTDINITRSAPIQNPYTYVQTEQKLQNMINQLLRQPEIAVDLQHSNKSYEGFTCLIQISSRTKDYIVDVFPIWDSMPLLKQVIENSAIIKVMHGAQMDTKWLQRDFNIHIHNLFDTYRAARTLGLQKLSYAFLLSTYCNVSTDKTYQTADWRRRPLSCQMLHYARLDTHYLLQIFDRMRAAIQQKALNMGLNPYEVLVEVYSASHEVTRNQVELFSFWKRDCLVQLSKEYKQPEYQLFQGVFGILNEIAKQLDVSFDQIVNHKIQRLIVSKLKELLLVKVQSVSPKIDRLISQLGQSESKEYFKNYTTQIKSFLDNYFEKRVIVNKKEAKVQKTKVFHIEEQAASFQKPQPSKYIFSISFKEHTSKTYENMSFNPFTMVKFEPIASFLAKKIGVQAKNQQQIQQEQVQDEIIEEMQQQVNNEQKQESNEEGGVIEFKRINPNVIYTIEDEQPAEKKHQPRKKRKEHQYQQKIKQKSGNIYQLLQE